MGFGPFVEGKTLVFFDEIQECPKARTAIKFLVEEHIYDFIESGSLLGINNKSATSYPVGYEERYDVYPLDFVIPDQSGVSIIEVKSGADYKKHASLDHALRSNNGIIDRAIVLCRGNIEKSENVLYLPLYMSSMIIDD